MEDIQSAGLLSKVFKLISRAVSTSMSRGLDWLQENKIDIEDKNVKATDDGGFMFLATTGSGKKLKVKCVPVAGKVDKDGNPTMYDVYCKAENGKKKDYPHTPESKFTDVITEFVDTYMDGDALEDTWEDMKKSGNTHNKNADFNINESKQIKVTLQKITSNKESSIRMSAVMANYDAIAVMDDIATVCNDDTFCDTLGTDPQSFLITQNQDSFLVENLDSVDTSLTYEVLIRNAYTTYLNLQAIHWNTFGKQFMRVHTMMDDYMDYLKSCIDRLAEINLQTVDAIRNPVDIVRECVSIVPSANFDGLQGAAMAKDVISAFIAALELYYTNVPHEVQSEFDDWIGYFKTEALFKLRRI